VPERAGHAGHSEMRGFGQCKLIAHPEVELDCARRAHLGPEELGYEVDGEPAYEPDGSGATATARRVQLAIWAIPLWGAVDDGWWRVVAIALALPGAPLTAALVLRPWRSH
jgi:hypothetical protein